jgi:hypothetical protein
MARNSLAAIERGAKEHGYKNSTAAHGEYKKDLLQAAARTPAQNARQLDWQPDATTSRNSAPP